MNGEELSDLGGEHNFDDELAAEEADRVRQERLEVAEELGLTVSDPQLWRGSDVLEDVVGSYIATLRKRGVELLDVATEVQLSEIIQSGQLKEASEEAKQAAYEARKRLVEANLRWVIVVAKRYRGLGVDYADLIQVGNLALVYAARRFDHNKGARFTNYATRWIRWDIMYAIHSRGLIQLPPKTYAAIRRLEKRQDILRAALLREPNTEELAEELGKSVEEIEWLLHVRDLLYVVGLDAPADATSPNEGTWLERVADEPLTKHPLAVRLRVLKLMADANLTPLERDVLMLRASGEKPMTYRNIATFLTLLGDEAVRRGAVLPKDWHFSYEYVRKIVNMAVQKLQDHAQG